MREIHIVNENRETRPERVRIWKRMSHRMDTSKRVKTLKAAMSRVPHDGTWNIAPSISFPGLIAITREDEPVMYLRPQRRLFWYTVENPSKQACISGYPFLKLLRTGDCIKLPDIIKALKYGE